MAIPLPPAPEPHGQEAPPGRVEAVSSHLPRTGQTHLHTRRLDGRPVHRALPLLSSIVAIYSGIRSHWLVYLAYLWRREGKGTERGRGLCRWSTASSSQSMSIRSRRHNTQ